MYWGRAEQGEQVSETNNGFSGRSSSQGGGDISHSQDVRSGAAVESRSLHSPQAGAHPTILGGKDSGGQESTRKGAELTGGADRRGEGSMWGEDQGNIGSGAVVPSTPEGYVFEFSSGVAVDEQALGAFRELAFEHGISQEQAASIAGLYANLVEKQAAGEQAILAENEDGWLKELRQSRHYAKTVASARLTMERFGTPELNDLLNETRLGSHPALVQFVARIGQELGEPVFMQGKGHGKTGKLNFYETMEG